MPLSEPRIGHTQPFPVGSQKSQHRVPPLCGSGRSLISRWKLICSAELDLLQLFSTVEDPGEWRNLLRRRPDLAAGLERALFCCFEKVERKSYRPLLSGTGISE